MEQLPVALFTSAWIETRGKCLPSRALSVALFTSAWIETLTSMNFPRYIPESHSSRVRGLKQEAPVYLHVVNEVALFTSAWIETMPVNPYPVYYLRRTLHECVDWNQQLTHEIIERVRSHSSRVRGLKRVKVVRDDLWTLSHSSRVRGLKHLP